MPISALLKAMDPPAAGRGAGGRQRPRTTATSSPSPWWCRRALGFPDNWIYVHSPEVRLGRIQNFGSWSPYLVKEGRTCLGLEYFVFEGDDLWASADADLVELGKQELERLGLVDAVQRRGRLRGADAQGLPVYDATYKANVDTMRAWIEANTPNVFPVGRNGMHRYNNQDHSMYTAMLSVREHPRRRPHDIWNVNVEEEYHEEKDKKPDEVAS